MRFSVIIPTRNRAAYLQHCIQSCLTQEESADEILVCDNSSPEQAAHTQRVVNDFSSFNVRYLPPDARPLNMTDNWNRAIQAAVGDYVTVLGDDDGLTPACVRIAKTCARRFDCDAFRWGWAFYHWPCFKYRNLAGRGFTPLPGNSDTAVVQRMRSMHVLRRVVNGAAPYVSLPMLYNSFVHRRVLDRIAADGQPLLDAQCPDIYSGVAIAAMSHDVLSTDFPLAIAGQSSASNGAAHENKDRCSDVANDFLQLNESQRIGHLQGTVAVGKLSLAVTDAYVRFKSRLPDQMRTIRQSRRRLAYWQASDLGELDRDAAPAPRDDAAYRLLLAHYSGVPFSTAAIRRGYEAGRTRWRDYPSNGIHSDQLFFDASTFHASNVSEVARSLGAIVGSPPHVVPGWGLKPRLKFLLTRWAPPAVKDLAFDMGRWLRIDPGNT